MQKGLYKRSGLNGLFTDFKHHAKSWRNSKRMRAKRERQWLKKDGDGMDDYDYCEECHLYGDDYSYDRDGDLVSNCYDCPMNPDSDAWMR